MAQKIYLPELQNLVVIGSKYNELMRGPLGATDIEQVKVHLQIAGHYVDLEWDGEKGQVYLNILE